MNLSCFQFEFQNNRLTGEARTVGVVGSDPERARAAREQAEEQARRNHPAERQQLSNEVEQSITEKQSAARSEIDETQHAFENEHLEAQMGLGTMQAAVENLQTRFQTLTANPSPRDFDALAQDAISVRNQIQQWVRHRTLMAQIRERHLDTDSRVVEIRRKLTIEGAEGQTARNAIQAQNDALQNILAPATAAAPAEQATAPAPAPGETPQAPGAPETPADQNENPVSPISTVSAFLGGGILGATGEKIGKFIEGAWEGIKKFMASMSVTFRYALGLSPEKLKSWGITTNSDELYPEGTGLSWWEVAGMSPDQLRIFTKAASRLDMISEATRGPILKMKFSEFARKLPTQLSSDSAEQTQLARLKTFLNEKGAPPNEIMAVVLGRIITDQQWNGYSPESTGTTAPLVQGNRPGEAPQAPLTPETRTREFFSSIRSELHGEFSQDAEQALRRASAQAIARNTLTRPSNVPERAWNTIYNALHGQQIADANMTVDQFLQQKFQNQNYNPAIATA